MITWTKLVDETPMPNREFVAKNANKEALDTSSLKKCKIMKFAGSFNECQIIRAMNESGSTHWSYTD